MGPKARVGLDAFGMGGVGCALGGQGRGPPAARKEKEKKKNVRFHNWGHAAKDGKLSFFRDGAKSS